MAGTCGEDAVTVSLRSEHTPELKASCSVGAGSSLTLRVACCHRWCLFRLSGSQVHDKWPWTGCKHFFSL